jgi:Fe2+ or Zn2+ uptake regulation protein
MSFVEEASDAIRAAGGRLTTQRRLILDLLERTEGHLDAERLYLLAHHEDAMVSLATIYRTLNVLRDANLIDQRYFSSRHDKTYYEPANTSEHYHFTCRNCGSVIEFDTPLVVILKQDIEKQLNVSLSHSCMCFEGLCADCGEMQE